MPFYRPLTESPARIEATRYARKSAVENRNSKFPYCRLRGLSWPTRPGSRHNSSIGMRQTAVERLPGLEKIELEATICMKKNGLSRKSAKLAESLCY